VVTSVVVVVIHGAVGLRQDQVGQLQRVLGLMLGDRGWRGTCGVDAHGVREFEVLKD